MILGVQVKPNARETKVVGWLDTRTVIVAVSAPPVDGKANEELVRFLARTLDLARSSVVVQRGVSGRNKLVALPDGTSLAPLGFVGLGSVEKR